MTGGGELMFEGVVEDTSSIAGLDGVEVCSADSSDQADLCSEATFDPYEHVLSPRRSRRWCRA